MVPQGSRKVDTNWNSDIDPQPVMLLKELGGWISEGELELFEGGQVDKGGQIKKAREALEFVRKLDPDAVGIGAVEDHVGFGAKVPVREA